MRQNQQKRQASYFLRLMHNPPSFVPEKAVRRVKCQSISCLKRGLCINRFFIVFVIFVTLLSLTPLSSSPVSAYLLYPFKWKDTGVAYYSINSNLDANLRVTGATNIVENQAAAKWNTGRLLLVRDQSSSNTVRAVDFRYYSDPVCGQLPYGGGIAATCLEPDTGDATKLAHARMYLDISDLWVWNSSGNMYCANYPGSADVLNVVMHEFGHVYTLNHDSNHTEAVMWPDCTIKYDLRADDTNGATQIYGPRTGWEPGFARGEINTIAYALNVTLSLHILGLASQAANRS